MNKLPKQKQNASEFLFCELVDFVYMNLIQDGKIYISEFF